MIPYGRQDIDAADITAVTDALKSDWLTTGPAVPRFEETVARRCNVRFAVAVANATAALHIACLALELQPGDVLWTTPNTFVASANCALYVGADVDFVDIDPRTYNMCADALAAKLVAARASGGRLPKVVVPVDFAGQSCDMARIRMLANEYGFRILQDASHAIGAEYRGTPVGSCRDADITVFSFHPVKIVTTGEGGMALTNDPVLYSRLALLRTHGITRDVAGMTGESHGPWYYEQVYLGYNYRMTDLQAALGTSQMARLDVFVARRRELARRYDRLLSQMPVATPWQHPDTNSAWHLYIIRLDQQAIGKSRRQVFEAMRAAGIGVNVHYIPVHLQPWYGKLGFSAGMFPEVERYYEEALTIPLFARMTDADQDAVVTALKNVIQ